MDPYLILGVRPGASERELSAAYREQAKRWHPDRHGEAAAARMAEVNVAYDLLRAELRHGAGAAPAAAANGAGPGPVRPRRGDWLAEPVRRALGPELVAALTHGEDVRLVTPASTWASPRALLAVTDRRLLWLLDDAPVARVRFLAFRDVAEVSHRLRRVRRRVATLDVRARNGRRHTFTDLRPHTAAAVVRHVASR